MRVTRPAASRAATILVIDGGWTRSCVANSPGVSGPCLSSVAKAASWVIETEVSTRSARKRRASRITDMRSSLARAVSATVVMSLA